MKVWEDARVIRGMRAQLETRRKRLERGDAPLGWKVGFAAPTCSSASASPARWWASSPAMRSSDPARPSRSPAGPSPWPSRKSPFTSGATLRAGPIMPPPKPRSPASRRRSSSPTSPRLPRIPRQSSAPTFISATSCSPARLRRAPAPRRTASCAASTGAAASSPAPTIRRPTPANGSTSCATSRTCSRLAASGCAAAKSSSPARWCRRLRSSRAKTRSRSRSIRSAASTVRFSGFDKRGAVNVARPRRE